MKIKSKIIIPTLASVLLVSTMDEASPIFYENPKKPILLEEIISKPEEKMLYPWINQDVIYSIIDRTIAKKRKQVPKYLDREFFRWVVFIESSDNPHARSDAGARGLMQLTAESWSQVRTKQDYFDKVYDSDANISAGIDYFKWLNEYCKQNHPHWNYMSDDEKRDILLASYNGGITRLSNKGWDIARMPNETKNYINRIGERINSNG